MLQGNRDERDQLAQESFASHAVRLTPRDWLVAGVAIAALLILGPIGWRSAESTTRIANYRVPFEFSRDYWLIESHLRQSAENDEIMVLGDSVIWGEYVTPQQTLTASLNESQSARTFSNGGVNGVYPIALAGLLESYGDSLAGSKVVVHLNLLWMSSSERDLAEFDENSPINHVGLLPQWWNAPPAYKPGFEERVQRTLTGKVPARQLARHFRWTAAAGQDIPGWTLEHPYANPLPAFVRTPRPSDAPRHVRPRESRPPSWEQAKLPLADLPWIASLEDSWQWLGIQRLLDDLRGQGGRCFVVVGPLNTHMLVQKSHPGYVSLLESAATWLAGEDVPLFVATTLPSEEYADLSHPLEAGYRRLAAELLASDDFQAWLSAE